MMPAQESKIMLFVLLDDRVVRHVMKMVDRKSADYTTKAAALANCAHHGIWNGLARLVHLRELYAFGRRKRIKLILETSSNFGPVTTAPVAWPEFRSPS